MKWWTKEEEEYLINNYSNNKNEILANALNRNKHSVLCKASKLKLIKSDAHKSEVLLARKELMIKRNKTILGRDLNFENLKEIAKKYKTRGDFQFYDPSAYSSARKNFGLDIICPHMFKQSYSTPQLLLYEILKIILKNIDINYNDRIAISPYELDIYIPKYKLGIEYNGKAWHKDNKKDLIKKKRCKKNKITLITIVENNRNYTNDVKKQLIDNLKLLNLTLGLNLFKNEISSINDEYLYKLIHEKILDVTDVKKIISKYEYYSDFRKNEIKLYNKLLKNKMLKEFTKDLIKTREKWTLNRIAEVVSKYDDFSKFLKNENACYIYVKRHKLEHMLSNLKMKYMIWSFDLIKKIIIEDNLNTTYKIKKYYSGGFKYLKKHKLIDECRIFIKENL